MKKIVIIETLSMLFLVLCASLVFAADRGMTAKDDGSWKLKPTLSVGYAFGGATNLTFTGVHGASLLGANRIAWKIPNISGVYIAGELPVMLTDRLNLALGGRWVFPGSDKEVHEGYNYSPTIGRDWNSDERDWVTVDLSLSYAFVKNASFLKDISAVVGFRWDYHNISFENPHNPVGVASGPTDTVDFKMNTYSPVFGLTSTFKGFKSGIFGGDIKIGAFASPVAWGDIEYKEPFGGAGTSISFDGNLDRCYFYNVVGEMTALSGKIAPKIEASLSIFAQYTKFFAEDRVSGTTTPVATRRNFDFSMHPGLATVGAKVAIAF